MKIVFILLMAIIGIVFASVSIAISDDSWIDKQFKKNQELLGDQIYTGAQPSNRIALISLDDGNGGQQQPIGKSQIPMQQPVFDPVTGSLLLPTAGGLINPETQTFYQEVADGYKNIKTGVFIPAD